MFPEHIISRDSDIPWPARSSALSPCAFFLWSYHKSNILMSKPRTIEELKQRIKEEIATMAEQMTRRVMENLRESFEQCLRNGGRHLNDVLFKT
jgi:hypothetical protein